MLDLHKLDVVGNRSFEILRAMLKTAREWGELRGDVLDACANIALNPKRPVARHLDQRQLARLGAVLEERRQARPWTVAALRLLVLMGVRVSEALNLRWDEIGALSEDGSSARLGDSKRGPRTICIGSKTGRLLSFLPRSEDDPRLFLKRHHVLIARAILLG